MSVSVRRMAADEFAHDLVCRLRLKPVGNCFVAGPEHPLSTFLVGRHEFLAQGMIILKGASRCRWLGFVPLPQVLGECEQFRHAFVHGVERFLRCLLGLIARPDPVPLARSGYPIPAIL